MSVQQEKYIQEAIESTKSAQKDNHS